MTEFWNSLKGTVAEIGGKIIGVFVTLATLAVTVWALLSKLREAKQETGRAKAEAAQAVTQVKMEEEKGKADELEKKYRDALDKYKHERDSAGGGSSVP